MADAPNEVLLDTHALIWWQAGGSRLSRRARRYLDEAQTVHVSPISFWELSMLVQKGRIALDRPTKVWVRDVLSDERLEIAELTPLTALLAGELSEFHGDPADRLIVATACTLAVPLMSKDDRIRAYAKQTSQFVAVW